MTTEQQIKKAMDDIEMAEVHMSEASKKYYSARKRLESLTTSASPKKGLDKSQVANLLSRRNKRLTKSKAA